jgi:hypothetical protein
MPKFFISHAVGDKKLVDSFVDLLQSGMNINFNDIYCTSHGKIRAGEGFVEDIRQNLISADLVLFLMTNSFFSSKFCLNEMGGTWALGKPFVPFIVPPANFSKLENTCLKGKQALRINIKSDLILFFEALIKNGIIQDAPYNRFEQKVTEFIRKRPWETSGLAGLLPPSF